MEENKTNPGAADATETNENEVKTYTQEEVDKLLQQESDRRVNQALKKQQEKFEKEKAESEKLRDMDEAQKKEYEYTKKMEELAAREKEFIITQNKLEASKILAERGLPVSFVDYIVAEDAETMMVNINTFDTAWKAAIADAVQQRLAQPAPKGSNVSQQGMTKEQFKKLTLAQQSEIYRTNPELYKQMTAY